jgi:hypothetical protein
MPNNAAIAELAADSDFDDLDFPLPEPDMDIEDYAHLSRPPASLSTNAPAAPSRARKSTSQAPYTPTPTASPPLTHLPNASYEPLPLATVGEASRGSAAVSSRIQGEVSAPVGQDWSTSFQGLSEKPFAKEVAEALMRPLDARDIEVKPGELIDT